MPAPRSKQPGGRGVGVGPAIGLNDRAEHLWLALALLGAMLRAFHVNHGLPYFTEEAFPFRHALTLWGADGTRTDLNPHWFAYPSLTIYLNFLVQWIAYRFSGLSLPADFLLHLSIDPTPVVVAARTISIAADVLSTAYVGLLTRPFGLIPRAISMALLVLSPWSIETSRLIYADSIMCAFSLGALFHLVRYQQARALRDLFLAAVLTGLAVGSKYPAIGMVLPLLVVAPGDYRSRHRFGYRLIALGVVMVVFSITSPYALSSWAEVRRDLTHMVDTTSRGGLGHLSGSSWRFYATGLLTNLGAVGVLMLLASSAWGWRSVHSTAVRLLWLSFLTAFTLTVAAPVEAHRYLLPAIAMGACLSGVGVSVLLARAASLPNARMIAWSTTFAALLQPAAAGSAAAVAGSATTQELATKWCADHVTASDLVLSEAYGPTLLTRDLHAEVRSSPLFGAASPSARAAYQRQPSYHLVWMPMLVGGYASIELPSQPGREVSVYPHAVDWNAATYDIRLLRGVDYVVTTSAVRGRYEQDSLRFAGQLAFYAFLDRHANRAASFQPTSVVEGPAITIYRLVPTTQRLIIQRGELDPSWWVRDIPEAFQRLAARDFPDGADGLAAGRGLPRWAQALKGAFAQRYAPFTFALGQNLASLGRLEPAEAILLSSLAIIPEDADAALVYSIVGGRLEHWRSVEMVTRAALAALEAEGTIAPALSLARAEALLRTGGADEAGAVAGRIAALGASPFQATALDIMSRARAARQPASSH